MDYKHTCDTTFKAYLIISMVLEDLFCSFSVLSVHPYFYPSIFVFTRPNDRWMGLYINYVYELVLSKDTGVKDVLQLLPLLSAVTTEWDIPSECAAKLTT